jgi:hypothetical protein
MLMAQITERFDDFLRRLARRAVVRLVTEETGTPLPPAVQASKNDVLAKIRMGARLRRALDEHIYDLVVYGYDRRVAMIISVAGIEQGDRPTWKEIGDALGTSPQAAHRKYGEAARANEASRGESDTPGSA